MHVNFKIVIIAISLLFISSCHSKFISLGNQICRDPVWNDSKTAITFVALQTASRAPVGIAKFPDGGRHKIVYSNLGLFVYKLNPDTLIKLTDFDGLVVRSRYNVKFNLVLFDSLVYYNVDYLRDNSNDSITIAKYSKHKYYSININSKIITQIDSLVFINEYCKHANSNRASLSETKALVKNIPYSNWGLVLKNIYPQSKKTYFDYIIEAKAGDAIFEQIVSGFSENDKKYIVKKMEIKQHQLLVDYETTHNANDGYRKSLRKNAYLSYCEYLQNVKKQFNFPVIDNKVVVRNTVINNLKRLNINLPNDFNIKQIRKVGDGFDAEFELVNADSISIDKYRKWFYNKVAYLLNNKWGLSEQTIFEKPNGKGIVIGDLVNVNWEHTNLKYIENDCVYYLDLSISYDLGCKHYFSFSVSEEVEDK